MSRIWFQVNIYKNRVGIRAISMQFLAYEKPYPLVFYWYKKTQVQKSEHFNEADIQCPLLQLSPHQLTCSYHNR